MTQHRHCQYLIEAAVSCQAERSESDTIQDTESVCLAASKTKIPNVSPGSFSLQSQEAAYSGSL